MFTTEETRQSISGIGGKLLAWEAALVRTSLQGWPLEDGGGPGPVPTRDPARPPRNAGQFDDTEHSPGRLTHIRAAPCATLCSLCWPRAGPVPTLC